MVGNTNKSYYPGNSNNFSDFTKKILGNYFVKKKDFLKSNHINRPRAKGKFYSFGDFIFLITQGGNITIITENRFESINREEFIDTFEEIIESVKKDQAVDNI